MVGRTLQGHSHVDLAPEDLGRGLAIEAAKRGTTVDALAAQIIAERVEPQRRRLRMASYAYPPPAVALEMTRRCSPKAPGATLAVDFDVGWGLVRIV